MASLLDCSHKPLKAGHWRSSDADGVRTIYHYSTAMLSFHLTSHGDWDDDSSTVVWSIGHGSVSDQMGMNRLFRELGMPFYYVRKGGASIEACMPYQATPYAVQRDLYRQRRQHRVFGFMQSGPRRSERSIAVPSTGFSSSDFARVTALADEEIEAWNEILCNAQSNSTRRRVQ